MSKDQKQNRKPESIESILTSKKNYKGWVSFAKRKLRNHKQNGFAREREAADYVEDAILKILSGEIVPTLESGSLEKFVCGIIKNEINVEFRKSRGLEQILYRDDIEDDLEGKEPDEKKKDKDFIAPADDPFEVKKLKLSTEEQMNICIKVLERKDPIWFVIFDERAKGHPNREIAEYLCLDVKEVEKMWKRIVRLLRKNVPEMGKVIFLEEERILFKAG